MKRPWSRHRSTICSRARAEIAVDATCTHHVRSTSAYELAGFLERLITEPRDCSLPCSGEQDYRYANLEFLVVRRDTRQALRGSGLLVHLIRDHRFFEGEHSPFRLAPERAAQVLGLV